MSERIVLEDQLRSLAHAHAQAVLDARGEDEESSASTHKQLLESFRNTWQPVLSDKEFTAVYRTYIDWVMSCIKNGLSPGSATPGPYLHGSTIGNDEEVHRWGATRKSPAEWARIIGQTDSMADQLASDVATIVRSGGDPDALIRERQYEATAWALDQDLTEEEYGRQTDHYRARFTQAMEREVERGQARVDGIGAGTDAKQGAGCLGVLALLALVPMASLVAISVL